MKKILGMCMVLLMLSACSTQKFGLSPQVNTIPSYEGTSHFVFWGIGQEKKYDPVEICGYRGVNAIDTHTSFLDGFLGALTWGIYAPESYAIYCNK